MKFQALKTILLSVFLLAQFQIYSQCHIDVNLYIDDNPNNGQLEEGVEFPATGAEIQSVYLVEVGPGYNPGDPVITTGAIVTLTLFEGVYQTALPGGIDCDKNYVVVVEEEPTASFILSNSGTYNYTPITGDNDNDFVGRKDFEFSFGAPIASNVSVSGVITFSPPFETTPVTVETTYPINSTDNEIYFGGLDLSGAVTYTIDGGALTGANGSNWTLDPSGYITYNAGSVIGDDVDMITIVADNGTDTDTTYVVINLIEEPSIITPTTVEATYTVNSTGNEIQFAGLDLSGAVTYAIDGGATTGANGSSWTLDPSGYITYDAGSVDGNDIDMITIVADNGTDTDTTYVVIN